MISWMYRPASRQPIRSHCHPYFMWYHYYRFKFSTWPQRFRFAFFNSRYRLKSFGETSFSAIQQQVVGKLCRLMASATDMEWRLCVYSLRFLYILFFQNCRAVKITCTGEASSLLRTFVRFGNERNYHTRLFGHFMACQRTETLVTVFPEAPADSKLLPQPILYPSTIAFCWMLCM